MLIHKKPSKILSALLALSMAFGLFAATAPAAGAAGSVVVINLSEDWFGKTNQSDPSGIWNYDAPLNIIKILGDVTIKGIVADTEKSLTLDINEKAKVTWIAELYGVATILISLRGGGMFEIADGGVIANTKGNFAIDINGSVTVNVNGGRVFGVTGTVINANGKDPSVTVSDGVVENTGDRAGAAIGVGGKVAINGGMIKSVGENATISGNAVTINGGTVINAGTGVTVGLTGDGAALTISGGLVESQNHGQTVNANGDMTMSGGIVRNSGDSQAIIPSKNLNISGGIVSAKENFAIYAYSAGAAVKINGGFIFAYGSNAVRAKGASTGMNENVIDGSTVEVNIGGNAIICAWNKAAKRTEYKEGTSDDLAVSPSVASAVWGVDGRKSGIKYANGTNTGFFEMGEVTVTASGQTAAQPTATPAATPTPTPTPASAPAAPATPAPTATPKPAAPSQTGDAWSVANDWAVPELQKAAEFGLIPETFNGMDFTRPITRAEFTAISVKVYEYLLGLEATPASPNPFTDTNDVYVLKAVNIGLTAGTGATTFEPDLLLNREQAATMLTRIYKYFSYPNWSLATDGDFPLKYTRQAPFADDANISPWARDSVYFMASNKIINGIGNNLFAPRNMTEAEEAAHYANATLEQALLIAVRLVLKFDDL